MTDERRAALRAEAKTLRGSAYVRRYFVALWTDVPDASDDAFLETLPEHFRHMSRLESDGTMFGSGPFRPPDGVAESLESMTIVRAASHDAAQAIFDAMPMARNGLRTYELFAWDMSVGSLTVRVALKSGALELE